MTSKVISTLHPKRAPNSQSIIPDTTGEKVTNPDEPVVTEISELSIACVPKPVVPKTAEKLVDNSVSEIMSDSCVPISIFKLVIVASPATVMTELFLLFDFGLVNSFTPTYI